MGRRQLSRLDISLYQRGLLERGLNRRHRHQAPDGRMERAMGYSSAIGTMVLDEVAVVNEESERRMDVIVTDLGKVERDIEKGHDWSKDVTETLRGMEVDIGGVSASQAFTRGEVTRLRTEMDALLHLNHQLVDAIVELRAAVRHGRNNPIVIEDSDDEGPETAVEEEGLEEIPGEHLLVEIVDETPAREIVDDREESPEV